ncbi:hypothetical protein EIP91_002435 [Steccherinum ochraceum]|uniref:PhoD-like phosphatase domain-containing protein n=1 Tax=Steccherinum ochraceum TaxID=92696 RepID=A0A4R0RC72_9APHY|nr:hypothetical protein EIP91_002435 [Steccherinum ochraceum]
MDSAGWHAQHRARKDDARWNQPQRGPDGRFQPVEQVYPMHEPFVGGFSPAATPPTNYQGGPPPFPPSPHPSPGPPPPIPPKDGLYQHNGAPKFKPQYEESTLSYPESTNSAGSYLYPTQQLAHMTPVERSQNLRIARMHPYLQFMAGPLLRYDTVGPDGVWRGAAMIVTADAGSIYDPYPTLTYVYDSNVPPNQHKRSPSRSTNSRGHSFELPPHPADPYASMFQAANNTVPAISPNATYRNVPGEELWVYAGNGGTFTFWRFMIEIPLAASEMRVDYCINNGQYLTFHVPGRNHNMRWAAFSCNGFSAGVNPDDFRGPGYATGYDPVWTDLLHKHTEQPFHALVGGGDQLYCDAIVREPEMQAWVTCTKAEKKRNFPLSEEMRFAIDRFYFNHYCQVFRSGAFARANSSIPMLNMLDDHDPDDLMRSPVFNTIGSRGYFFFLLFQCFINPEKDGLDGQRHPFKSIVFGGPGPYIPFPSHSFLSYLGPHSAILLLDCRAERKKDQVCSDQQYKAVLNRIYQLPKTIEHLVLLTGIPIAYPRMVFLETALESKMNPLTALGRNGSLGLSGFVNKFNADAELLDDLNDHWTAKSHKKERNWLIEQLQAYARSTQTRVSLLGGDVHCAAVGVLKTLVKGKNKQDVPPAMDYRYMVNVVSSAIVNTPPPNGVLTMVGALATKTHRTLHHMDTDESMIPVFNTDTNGSQPKNKYIMGRRNWCSVSWDPMSGDLIFDIRVEKEKGCGETIGYAVRAPAPRWVIT